MTTLGIHLNLWIGPTVPIPAPPMFAEALDSVEVTHSDQGRSGFQITFRAGRSGPADLLDYRLLSSPMLRPFSRVVLTVIVEVVPRVLMDGIITHQELAPGSQPGTSTLTVTGEDVSVMMDLEEKTVEHPGQDETVIANKILLTYAQYGIVPMVIPPPAIDFPLPIERVPVQQGTDLQYLRQMAQRYGYVFYVEPGPAPLVNTAYWGPPVRLGVPQRALSVNMGPDTNVESIRFQNDGLASTLVSGQVQDRLTNQSLPVQTFASLRPPLVSQPAWLTQKTRTRQFRESGLNVMQAFARAQGLTDASVDSVISATGELDALSYGDLLQARALVGLRGAGYSYSGLYYVQSVTHAIRQGSYKQRFTLTREGLGSLTPGVRP